MHVEDIHDWKKLMCNFIVVLLMLQDIWPIHKDIMFFTNYINCITYLNIVSFPNTKGSRICISFFMLCEVVLQAELKKEVAISCLSPSISQHLCHRWILRNKLVTHIPSTSPNHKKTKFSHQRPL